MAANDAGEHRIELGQNILAGEVLLPRLIVKQPALEYNIQRMAQYCHGHGVSLAPHAKTTMSPGIIARQAAAGVWGFTVATIAQAQTLRRLNIERILIANEVAEARGVAWLANEISAHEEFDAVILADSLRGVTLLNSTLDSIRPKRPLGVLIELGEHGGRAGCRTDQQAVEVAQAVSRSSYLRLAGIEGFEALLEPALVGPFLRRLRDLAVRLVQEGYFAESDEVIISAGSSEHLEAAVQELTSWDLDRAVRVLLRPGGYALNTPIAGYLSALEVWGAVVSRPEAGLAIAGFGRRDVPWDPRFMPTPVAVALKGRIRATEKSVKIRRLYDQHALVDIGSTELDVGEFVGCSIVSPYQPAFATWRVVPLVDDTYTVLEVLEVLY